MAPAWTNKALDHIRRKFPTPTRQTQEDEFSTAAVAQLPHPPFPHLIYSNIAPDDNEKSVISKIIHLAKAEESRLRDLLPTLDLSRLDGKAEKNTIERSLGHVKKYIREHEAILSPWRRNIPPELLALIFDFVHSRVWQERNGVYARKKGPPWAILQVCRRWRGAALSSANLWIELPSINLSSSKCTDPSYLKFLEELLERSHQAPIYIQLLSWASGLPEVHPTIEILVRHSERWRTLDVHTYDCGPLFTALRRATGRLSSLVSLKLTLHFDLFPVFLPKDIIQPFEVAPQLSKVEFEGLHLEDIILPYPQLISLSLRRCNDTRFYGNISLCTNLQLLDMNISEDRWRPNLNNPPMIYLTNLISLRITSDVINTAGVISSIMLNLSTPSIEELHIIPGHDEPRVFHLITSFLSRLNSPCLLKRLHVGPTSQTNEELLNLLKLMPLITYIDVPLPPSPTMVLRAIKDTPSLSRLLQSSVFRRGQDAHVYTAPPFPMPANIGSRDRRLQNSTMPYAF